jgi:hypothetical protein
MKLPYRIPATAVGEWKLQVPWYVRLAAWVWRWWPLPFTVAWIALVIAATVLVHL